MPVEITHRSDLPVLIFTVVSHIKPPEDQELILKTVSDFKQKTGGHVYRVIDITGIKLDFGMMVASMGAERGQPGGADDPDVTTIFVATDEIAKIGAKSLREQPQYGQGDVRMASSVEEALDIVRQDVQ